MRVVSFVPSWTETLIEAGVKVVGRTRFCIHPASAIKTIPVVGGTKNIHSVEQVLLLQPDLVLFDKEENNQEMFQSCLDHGLNCYATHVTSLISCGEELKKLGSLINNQQLIQWGEAYLQLQPCSIEGFKKCILDGDLSLDQSLSYSYVIWQNPFMIVSNNTFIGSMLNLFNIKLATHPKKYPEISDDELKKTFCFFSSEPFPFAKYYGDLCAQGYRGVLVDGEKMSWYGVRALKFLQSLEQS